MENMVVIHHANCMDGLAAAAVVKLWVWERYLKGNKVEFIAAHYGDTPPDVTGKIVYVLDFSYPREILLEMEKQARFIRVIDHHKTAQEALKGLEFYTFRMDLSGAVLSYMHFFPEMEIPRLLLYVQDSDLCRWSLTNSREINAALSFDMRIDRFFELLRDEFANPDLLIGRLVKEGEAIICDQEHVLSQKLNNIRG